METTYSIMGCYRGSLEKRMETTYREIQAVLTLSSIFDVCLSLSLFLGCGSLLNDVDLIEGTP